MRTDKFEAPKLLVSKKAAAAALDISLRKLESYIASDALPTRRLGRRRLIPLSALLAFARNDH
jgi:hypothetical protein